MRRPVARDCACTRTSVPAAGPESVRQRPRASAKSRARGVETLRMRRRPSRRSSSTAPVVAARRRGGKAQRRLPGAAERVERLGQRGVVREPGPPVVGHGKHRDHVCEQAHAVGAPEAVALPAPAHGQAQLEVPAGARPERLAEPDGQGGATASARDRRRFDRHRDPARLAAIRAVRPQPQPHAVDRGRLPR